MTFDEFISKWNNQPIDFDGVYPNQCMDLMHQYVYDVLNLKDKSLLAAPAAYQVYVNFKPDWGQYFTKVDNTPAGIPQKGDIIFFGTGIGPYGHVCIFIEGGTDNFTSLDANWPLTTPCHIQNHNYSGVLGWLHPKVVQSQQPTMPPYLQTLFQEQKIDITNESMVRAFFQQAIDYPNLKTDYDNSQRQLTTLSQRVNDLTQTNNMQADVIGHLNQNIADLKAQIPITPTPTKPTGFWKWLKEIFS